MSDQFHSGGLYATALALAVLLSMLHICSCSDSNPAAPSPGTYYPVQESSQLQGRWNVENVFAGGLPVGGLLVPGATAGMADSRLSSFAADLAVSATDGTTGVFSTEAHGTAADTTDPTATVSGSQRTAGGFTLWGEGQIEITLSSENGRTLPTAKTFLGTASTMGDTLVLEFHFAVPPRKAVFFLPDTVTLLARLVRQ